MSDDLDQLFSHLPQPYRMICKIIELEILDPAWLIITRKHPDLLLGSDGQPIEIPRNHRLNNSFIPKQPPTNPKLWTSVAEVSRIIFGTTITGECTTTESTSSIFLSSVKIFPTLLENESFYSPPWIADLVQNPENSVITVCTAVLYQSVEVPDPNAAPAGKKGGGKKGASVEPIDIKPKIKRKCFLTVASISMGVGPIASPSALAIIETITVDVDETDDDRSVTVDIFSRDNLLAVTTSHSGCTVYGFNFSPDTIDHAPMQPTPAATQTDPAAPPPAMPDNVVCVMGVSDLFGGKALKGCVFSTSTDQFASSIAKKLSPVEPKKGKSGTDPTMSHSLVSASGERRGSSAALAAARGVIPKPKPSPVLQLLSMFNVESKEMVVVFEQAHEWAIVDLHKPKAKPAAPVVEQAPVKGAAKGKKVEEAPPPPPVNPNMLVATVVASWQLPSKVTAYKLDDRRLSLLFGLQDGSVTMWDLKSKTFVAVLGQHLSPVVSVAFCSSPLSAQSPRQMISGSSDGILCFHTHYLKFSVDNVTTVASEAQALADSQQLAKSTLSNLDSSFPDFGKDVYATDDIAFRHDVPNATIVKITPTSTSAGPGFGSAFKYPLVMVYYSNETVALYDYETASLLGQLKFNIPRSLTDPTWHPATVNDVVAVALLGDALSEGSSVARVGTDIMSASIMEGEENDEEAEEVQLADAPMPADAFVESLKKLDPQYHYVPNTEMIQNKQTARLSAKLKEALEESEDGGALKAPENAIEPSSVVVAPDNCKRHFPHLCLLTTKGVTALFVKDDRTVLKYIDIKIDDIILQSYAVFRSLQIDNLPKYFGLVTKEERLCQSLARERVSEILGLVDDRFHTRPGGKTKKATPFSKTTPSQASVQHSSNADGPIRISSPPPLHGPGHGVSHSSLHAEHVLEHNHAHGHSHANNSAHLAIKPWGMEGKELPFDSTDSLSVRSSDSVGSSSILGIAANNAAAIVPSRLDNCLEIDFVGFGDAGYVFDPVHVARRVAFRNKQKRMLNNIGTQPSLAHGGTASLHTASMATGRTNTTAGAPSAKPSTTSLVAKATTGGAPSKKDPVLSLLGHLAEQFKETGSLSNTQQTTTSMKRQ